MTTTSTLYVVPTPIGNLSDMSPRAMAVLAEVDVIASEDTRTTRKLLNLLSIAFRGELLSCHAHNEAARAEDIVQRLQSGQSVALVSDAGTPIWSDPGHRVVAAVAAAGLTVCPLPGPVAFATALSASALPAEQVLFVGFLPSKRKARRDSLLELAHHTATLALYVSPHRAKKVLEDALEVLGPRPACLARELTKLHEELLRGTLETILVELEGRVEVMGEIVLLIHGAPPRTSTPDPLLDEARALARLLTQHRVPPKDAKSILAAHHNLSKKEAYELLLESR